MNFGLEAIIEIAAAVITLLLFELWVLPVLCILYNQVIRERGSSI